MNPWKIKCYLKSVSVLPTGPASLSAKAGDSGGPV